MVFFFKFANSKLKRMFKNFSLGITTYSEAHRFIKKHKLWGYVVLPGILNIILLTIIIILGWNFAAQITDYIFDLLGLNKEITGFTKYLVIGLSYVLKFGLRIIFIIVYFSIYQFIVLMIMSPILAFLSEKTEKLINGSEYPFSMRQLIKDIIRGNIIVVRNIFVELFWIIIFFFVSYIPIIGLLSPVVLFIIAGYFYGFSMIDYCSERHKLSIHQSVHFVRKNKGFAISNGIIFYLLLLIPFVGVMIAPSYAVVAATIGTEKIRSTEEGLVSIGNKKWKK